MRDTDPTSWVDAVDFDHAIRNDSARGMPRRGHFNLHDSLQPLDQAPIEHVTRAEWASRQTNLFGAIADTEAGFGDEYDDLDDFGSAAA